MRAATIALICIPALLPAQGMILPRCPRPMPGVELECRPVGQQIVRTRSEVRVELRDRVLRYEVEERFENRGGMVGEADYVFPLPGSAAFRDLKLSIDGELVAGETMNEAEARRIYEDIVRSRRDPALVEWMGHGMLRTRIFPIRPGEERRVVVRYERVAEREGDALRVDYFRGGETRAAEGRWELTHRGAQPAGVASRSSLTLSYLAGGELGEAYSPTHELDVEREGVRREVRIRGGSPDVTVLVALRRARDASITMLPHASGDEPGYALITVTPPAELAGRRMPRDVTFAIDVSGSMSGRKLEQAKAAGRQLLRTLGPQDRFRLIDFSSDVRTFRREPVFATEDNVRSALEYLEDLDATGATNISEALDEALRESGVGSGSREAGVGSGSRESERLQKTGVGSGSRESERLQKTGVGSGSQESGRLALVLFLTDGAPTAGERDAAAIAARAARMRGGARIFTFGVGADLNVGLIEQLALEGRGTAHFVRPEESVERAVELVATRLREPLLRNVRITTTGDVRLSRAYPTGELDVFAGQDLVVLARYTGQGRATLVVTGHGGAREVRWTAERNFPAHERGNAFVPRLWATQRIGWLSAEKRRSGGSSEIDSEIRQLGERFGIPTEFTSYLVLEPGMLTDRRRRDPVPMPLPMPGPTRGPASVAAGTPAAQFEQAREAAALRSAKSLAAADEAAPAAAATRRVGDRVFVVDAGRWVDSRIKPELRVYKVKAYSREYFRLLDRMPELRPVFALGNSVLVAGRAAAIEVAAEAPELADRDVDTIVKRFGPDRKSR